MKIQVTYKSGSVQLFAVPEDISVMDFHELATSIGGLITGIKFI